MMYLAAAKAITPELQRRVQALLVRFKSLPGERRGIVEQACGEPKMMPPNQRQQVLNSAEFKNTFSDDERDLLNSLLDLLH